MEQFYIIFIFLTSWNLILTIAIIVLIIRLRHDGGGYLKLEGKNIWVKKKKSS